MRGRWHVSPPSKVAMLPLSQNAEDCQCPLLREDACTVEPAIVYHAANEKAGSGGYSFSKRSGLPRKEEASPDARCHLSVRAEYGEQQAPVVEP